MLHKFYIYYSVDVHISQLQGNFSEMSAATSKCTVIVMPWKCNTVHMKKWNTCHYMQIITISLFHC